MNSKYSILLYSKYSTQSKKILDLMTSSNINFTSTVNLRNLCIDSKVVRDRIKNSKINIKYVPCILTIYSNGFVEKYDGMNAFNWVEEVIKQLTPPPPPPVIQQQPPIKKQVKFVEEADNYADDEVENYTTKEQTTKKKKSNNLKVTKIEDLEDGSDEEEEEVKPKKRKHLIRKNKGNYEAEEEIFSDDRAVDITTASKAIKEGDAGSATLSKAKELAKLRENDIAKENTSKMIENKISEK